MRKNILESQKGVALIIALIILLVLTLIGISAINTTTYETSISGNERAGTSAFYAAEGGTEHGINQLGPPPFDLTAIGRRALGSDSYYWSGRIGDKATGAPLGYLGNYERSGYDISSWTFKRLQVNSTGESSGANREVEVEVTHGPVKWGTGYNN